jgi:hypothetical protein
MELANNESGEIQDKLLGDLLRTDRVQWLLQRMDDFGPIEHIDSGVLSKLHGIKPMCLENVVARLLELGLRTGVSVFDEKMERLRNYVDNKLVRQSLGNPDNPTVEGGRAVFIAVMFASYFIRGGYYHDEVLNFVERRIAALSRLAHTRNYDIHLKPSELTSLPKQWAGKPIIRPELDPYSGTSPLPLVHDFFTFAYLPVRRFSRSSRAAVRDIVSYATDDRYRSFPQGYGYIWSKANRRTCYSCGWNLDLPDVDSDAPGNRRAVVQRLDLLSRLPTARKSTWFRKTWHFMERFRTADGTYRIPRLYLAESKTGGCYVHGNYMGLEDNRRSTKAIEIESTFRMLLINQKLLRSGHFQYNRNTYQFDA